MAFKTPVENYKRAPQPQMPESQIRYLQEELKKLERVLGTVTEALAEADARLKAANL